LREITHHNGRLDADRHCERGKARAKGKSSERIRES
jgi:hypothetical protein